MNYYTEQLTELVAMSAGKITVEELDRIITDGALRVNLDKREILQSLKLVLLAYDRVKLPVRRRVS